MTAPMHEEAAPMHEEAAPKPDASEVTDLVDADRAARLDARARAETCTREINAALMRHRCRIMPRIDPANIEPVGVAGDKIMIAATFWIAPLAP